MASRRRDPATHALVLRSLDEIHDIVDDLIEDLDAEAAARAAPVDEQPGAAVSWPGPPRSAS